MPRITLWYRPAIFPAAVLAILLLAAWAALWQASAGGQTLGRSGLIVGWLMAALLLASFTGILWAAGVPGPHTTRRTWLGAALLIDLLTLLIFALGLGSGILDLPSALRAALVLTSWIILLTALAGLLKHWGPGPAVTLASTAAVLLLALPVLAMPAFRLLSLPAQAYAMDTLRHACPTLAILDAVRPAAPFSWMEASVMYGLTAVGQDFPLTLPAWWIPTLIYALLGAVLAVWAHAATPHQRRA